MMAETHVVTLIRSIQICIYTQINTPGFKHCMKHKATVSLCLPHETPPPGRMYTHKFNIISRSPSY